MKTILYFLLLFAISVHAQSPVLYGVTFQGGSASEGNIFTISGTQYTDAYDFLSVGAYDDGAYLRNGLIRGRDGWLYGTTISVNTGGYIGGTVFGFQPSTGIHKILYSFTQYGPHGPGGVIQATDGKLYGVLGRGSAYDKGSIYSYDLAADTLTILHEFGATAIIDQVWPMGNLMQASDGLIYGTADTSLFSYNIATGACTKIHAYPILKGQTVV